MSNTNENAVVYGSGAKRSTKYGRYRDIPTCFVTRIANAFQEGTKYEKPEDGWQPYEKNWKRGDLVFALDCLDHAIRHLHLYSDVILARLNNEELDPELYDLTDDHLGNTGANLSMLAWFEEQGMFETPITSDKLESFLEIANQDNDNDTAFTMPPSVKERILAAFKLN